MQHKRGFTLIELMITVAVIAILSAIAYPSYQDHVRRANRSQGQQYLMDLAQRQEQYFLDRRAYASGANALTDLNMPGVPAEVSSKYTAPVVAAVAGPPVGFTITLAPIAGGMMAADGTLIINNLQQRWREVSSPGAFVAKTNPNDAAEVGDCRWEESRCVPR